MGFRKNDPVERIYNIDVCKNHFKTYEVVAGNICNVPDLKILKGQDRKSVV